MIVETIEIRAIPDAENPKLKKKHIGSKEYLSPKVGPDGKPITGIDENSYLLTSLPAEEYKKKKAAIKKEREELERLIGESLEPLSSFWAKFYYVLEDGVTLDPVNPRDRLIEQFLIANHYVAPDEESVYTKEEYMNCMFFMYRKSEVIKNKAEKDRAKDKATSDLYNLYTSNPSKLKVIHSFLFGITVSDNIELDEIYTQLKEFINIDDTSDINVRRFNEATNMSTDNMAIKLVLDKAIKKKVVTFKRNIYQRGDEVYGNGYDAALEYLQSPTNRGELSSLKAEIDVL